MPVGAVGACGGVVHSETLALHMPRQNSCTLSRATKGALVYNSELSAGTGPPVLVSTGGCSSVSNCDTNAGVQEHSVRSSVVMISQERQEQKKAAASLHDQQPR